MTDIDPSVYYWVSSQYNKFRQEFAEFYKSALLYLAYTSVESLSDSFKLECEEIKKREWGLVWYEESRWRVKAGIEITIHGL